MANTTRETKDAAHDVNRSADTLAGQSNDLRAQVAEFLKAARRAG